jgi:hypothetical protein
VIIDDDKSIKNGQVIVVPGHKEKHNTIINVPGHGKVHTRTNTLTEFLSCRYTRIILSTYLLYSQSVVFPAVSRQLVPAQTHIHNAAIHPSAT